MSHLAQRPGRPVCRQQGQSALEYLIVLALVGISLTAGPDSPLEQVFRAMAQHHARLTDALSRP